MLCTAADGVLGTTRAWVHKRVHTCHHHRAHPGNSSISVTVCTVLGRLPHLTWSPLCETDFCFRWNFVATFSEMGQEGTKSGLQHDLDKPSPQQQIMPQHTYNTPTSAQPLGQHFLNAQSRCEDRITTTFLPPLERNKRTTRTAQCMHHALIFGSRFTYVWQIFRVAGMRWLRD